MDVRIAPETLVPRLGDLLIERGLLLPEDLVIALDFQQQKIRSGVPCLIGQALLELGFVDQRSIDEVVTIQIFELQNKLERANVHLEQQVAERTEDLQEALDKLTELNQLKSNFLSNISHELRTPLTHIKGYLDILADHSLGPLTSPQVEALAVLKRSEDRLEQLIDDLLQFSLLAKGELDLYLQPLNILKLVDIYLPQNQRKADQKNVKLEIKVAQDLPEILADANKLAWVISQLLDNAIKFTPVGGQVNLVAVENTGQIEISVCDTGIGIPTERLGEIFEPFHQLDGSVTRRYPGTGLGLAMVHQILKAHGAAIKVTSKPEAGTYFSFSFPPAGGNYGG
ncbi:MAG: HAMP domain-containing histidine kinase [Anaerolineales bacterium]|nr:HAMP domain-containing histidine kinase [Anaerolineales bacterium]